MTGQNSYLTKECITRLREIQGILPVKATFSDIILDRLKPMTVMNDELHDRIVEGDALFVNRLTKGKISIEEMRALMGLIHMVILKRYRNEMDMLEFVNTVEKVLGKSSIENRDGPLLNGGVEDGEQVEQ